VTQKTADRHPRSGRRATDERGQGVLLLEQLVQIVDPQDLRLVAVDQDIGRARITPIMQQHAIPSRRDLAGERQEFVMRAPSARRERNPGPGCR
jgi:hypothetical protein